MARLPTNRDARKVAYLENCLARPPLALSFPTRSSSFGLPRIGVRRVYSFFPRTSSLFLQKSAKKCRKLQKSAKNGPFSAKSAQKHPSRRPKRGKTGSKLPETQQKAPKTPLTRARAHADERRHLAKRKAPRGNKRRGNAFSFNFRIDLAYGAC